VREYKTMTGPEDETAGGKSLTETEKKNKQLRKAKSLRAMEGANGKVKAVERRTSTSTWAESQKKKNRQNGEDEVSKGGGTTEQVGCARKDGKKKYTRQKKDVGKHENGTLTKRDKTEGGVIGRREK